MPQFQNLQIISYFIYSLISSLALKGVNLLCMDVLNYRHPNKTSVERRNYVIYTD